jgi:mRNA-degrading endonuclease RelE of RelBE toxin-antitoxin system
MKYEKAWIKGIENDLIGISEDQFNKLDEEFDKILDSPNSKTKRVKCWKENVRRIRFGNYRLLIYVCEESLTVYGLAFLPRKDSYSKSSQKLILKLVNRIQ